MLQALQDRLTVLEQTAIVPVGLIAYCRGPVPNGWLWMDGSAFDTARYGQLFAHLGIGTLPDGGGRVAVGLEAAGTFAVIGATGGVETVTLTAAQSGVPAHTHPPSSSNFGLSNAAGVAAAGAAVSAVTAVSTVTGANVAANASAGHTNLQPYIVLTPIIKV